MANNDEGAQALAGMFMVFLVVMVVLTVVGTIFTFGSVYGAYRALANYGRAFAENVKPEAIPA